MSLPLQQTRELFYRAYLAAYKEMIPVTSFLRSFFTTETTTAKTIALQVQRGSEKIAVDIQRGTDGTRNTFSLFTEKEYLPPFFNENFDATLLDRYDLGFNQDGAPPAVIGGLAMDVADNLNMLRDKIERAKELMCSQVFETGIVTMINGDNIDFKRKAGSIVDLVGNYWNVAASPIEAQLIAAAEFMRQTGKNGNPVLNLVMSGSAWVDVKNSTYFTNAANFRQVQLIDIRSPQTQAFGAAFHGQLIAGAYLFNVWTYDEVYEAGVAKTITRYFPDNKAFVVPTGGQRFTLAHAGVPAIIRDVNNAEFPQWIQQQAGEYWINNYIDPKAKSHTFEIMSAPVAIPVTVDMIYTMQVNA